MSHSPEPWRVENDTYGVERIWSESDNVASCVGDGFLSFDEQHANARRIAACVNVCKGIPTELLERAFSEAARPAITEWMRDPLNFIEVKTG